MDVPLPTRLIYIPEDRKEPLRLRTTVGQRGQYAALSYVWGNGTTFSSTKATLATRMEGFKLRELPKTVRDAVKIARHMGLQYLWVDALCIIQGDLYDWNYESAHMAEVYGRAAFTISADLARTTDSGILQPRELLRSHVFGQHEELCLQELENTWATLTGHPLYRRVGGSSYEVYFALVLIYTSGMVLTRACAVQPCAPLLQGPGKQI